MLVLARSGRPSWHGSVGRRAFWGACGVVASGIVLLCVGHVWPITLLGASLAGVACSMLVLLMPGIIADHHGDDRAKPRTRR